jgi:signal transduction histidine kinase
MSHELRTPLTAMQTENEVALRNPKLTKEQAKELLESNLEEVAKLRGLSEGLLRLALADSKDLPMRRVEVKKIIETAKGRIAKQAALRNVAIKVKLVDAHLQGDFESLVELLFILLDNAVKYSPEKTEVKVEAKRSNRSIVISVSDAGCGISGKDLPHIFERFYRSDASRSRTVAGGYGLGLSIAAKVAHIHGGRIDATSDLNKGSVFTVYLPVKKD